MSCLRFGGQQKVSLAGVALFDPLPYISIRQPIFYLCISARDFFLTLL